MFGVQSIIIDEDLGIVTATVTFFRSVRQAFEVAIGGTGFQNLFDRYLVETVATGKVPQALIVPGAQSVGA